MHNVDQAVYAIRMAMCRSGVKAMLRTLDNLHIHTMDKCEQVAFWDQVIVICVEHDDPEATAIVLDRADVHYETYTYVLEIANKHHCPAVMRLLQQWHQSQ